MGRPCKDYHEISPEKCKMCFWCIDRSETGRKYRELWECQLPEDKTNKCKYLKEELELEKCGTCQGNVRIKIMKCDIYGKCTTHKKLNNYQCCVGCKDFSSDYKDYYIKELKNVINQSWEEKELSGTGLIICGGNKFWPGIVVSIKMFRKWSNLPIQVWHRKDEKVNKEDIEGIEGITIINANNIPHRILKRWEIKTLALLNCGWEKALYLDADAYFVEDPKEFIDLLNISPFVFWEDLDHNNKTLQWGYTGIDNRLNVPVVQGGQLAIDIKKFWRELNIVDWVNQHSDYFYDYQFGDQDSWRLVLAATGKRYLNLGIGNCPWGAYLCNYPINNTLIVHRCNLKMFDYSEVTNKDECKQPQYMLPRENEVWEIFNNRKVDIKKTFDNIYKIGLWGEASGAGSRGEEADKYVKYINELIEINDWKEVVDLGCGDGEIGSRIKVEKYIGIDITKSREDTQDKTWLIADIINDELPNAEVCLIKDVLQHWPNKYIIKILGKLMKKYKIGLITNDSFQEHEDIPFGAFRGLELNKYPLNMFIKLREQYKYLNKTIIMWI